MRAFALTVTTFCLATLAQGFVDYQLTCDREEIGIRWPSYHSNSDYYMCTRIGGKQVKMSCNAGELFTFVLQQCTSPGRFIPPPPMDILPTHSPLNNLPYLSAGNQQQKQNQEVVLPKPMYPSLNQPPMISNQQSPQLHSVQYPVPPSLESSAFEPPHVDHVEEQNEFSNSEESSAPAVVPSVPVKPSSPKKLQSNVNKVPVPPTPEPTPPVVKKQPGKKTPQATDNSKSVKKPVGPPRKNSLPSPPQKSAKPPKKVAPAPLA